MSAPRTRILRGSAVFGLYDRPLVLIALVGFDCGRLRPPLRDRFRPVLDRGAVHPLRVFDIIQVGLYIQVRVERGFGI